MLIRRYAAADRPRVLEIWRAAVRHGHPFLGLATLREQERKVRDLYLPVAENWIAERRGRALGFIGLLDGHVGGLFVDPACHREGVGRALVEHAADLHGRLTVAVYEANPGALAFYRRCGFLETVHRPRDADGRPFPVIEMRRD